MGIEPGIPAFDAGGGIDLVEGGKENGKKLDNEYNEKYYHHPSDEFDPVRWKLDGVMEDIQLFFLVGKRLAFETTWPKWKQGSEFKAIRENASNKKTLFLKLLMLMDMITLSKGKY